MLIDLFNLNAPLQGKPGLAGLPGLKGSEGAVGKDGRPGLDGFPGPQVDVYYLTGQGGTMRTVVMTSETIYSIKTS